MRIWYVTIIAIFTFLWFAGWSQFGNQYKRDRSPASVEGESTTYALIMEDPYLF